MSSKTFKTTILRDGHGVSSRSNSIPKLLWQGARAGASDAEWLHLSEHDCGDGGSAFIPFRRSNREAAGLEGGETLQVRVELDTEKREVKPPPDLVKALKAAPAALERWRALSYTHQREHVEAIEEAKKPETRARGIDGAVRMLLK